MWMLWFSCSRAAIPSSSFFSPDALCSFLLFNFCPELSFYALLGDLALKGSLIFLCSFLLTFGGGEGKVDTGGIKSSSCSDSYGSGLLMTVTSIFGILIFDRVEVLGFRSLCLNKILGAFLCGLTIVNKN